MSEDSKGEEIKIGDWVEFKVTPESIAKNCECPRYSRFGWVVSGEGDSWVIRTAGIEYKGIKSEDITVVDQPCLERDGKEAI